MPWQWIILPLVGAFIGWLTNRLAIRLLFRPHRPVRVLGMEIQGLLPRRRTDLSRSIGRVLEDRVLTEEAMMERLCQPEVIGTAAGMVEDAARETLEGRLWMIPGLVSRPVAQQVGRLAGREARRYLLGRAPELVIHLRREVPISDIVTQELDALPLDDLENLVLELARKELRHIEHLGGLLGFLIGLMQAGLLQILR